MSPGVPCPKVVRVRSRKNLDAVRRRPCRVCGNRAEVHHIQTRGAGGGDELGNLIALCHRHHMEAHRVGWLTFREWHGL